MTISNASGMFLMSILKGNVTILFASKCWITEKIFENLIQISQSHDLPHAYIVSDDELNVPAHLLCYEVCVTRQ